MSVYVLDSNIISLMKHLLIYLGILTLMGCASIEYEKSININAPKDYVFTILEDYENYPDIIPEFHEKVKITVWFYRND